MYNDAWDDYYDHREDAREDWADHREDLAEERGDRAGNAQEQRTERQGTKQEQRTERQGTRQENRPTLRRRADSGAARPRRKQRPLEPGARARMNRAGKRGWGRRERRRTAAAPARTPSPAIRAGSRSAPRARAARAAGAARARAPAAAAGGDDGHASSDRRGLDGPGSRGVRAGRHRTRTRATHVRHAGRSGARADRGRQGKQPRRPPSHLRTRERRTDRVVGCGNRAQDSRSLHRGHRRGLASAQSGRQPQNTHRRQRGVAVPGSAREEREAVAVRHRRRQRRSARAPDRSQRAGGDWDLPHLCRCAALLRATGSRWKARGPVCDHTRQRSGQAERTLLAGRAWSATQSPWRPGGEGLRGRPEDLDGWRAAHTFSRLLLQDPDCARAAHQAEPSPTSSTARCRPGSRSSRGRRNTTPAAS